MQNRSKLKSQLGAVYIPLADDVIGGETEPPRPPSELIPDADGGLAPTALAIPMRERFAFDPRDPWWPQIQWKFCRTVLEEGCYTLSFTPNGAGLFSTRYRGTLRVEPLGFGYRMSGDLYRYRIIDLLSINRTGLIFERVAMFSDTDSDADHAADAQTIPIYKRADYQSYLRGVFASMWQAVPAGSKCTFALTFDEFEYDHPATGFDGSFRALPDRSIRFEMSQAETGLYTGSAYEGTTKIGTVSIRHISSFYRRATVRLHTLDGAEDPPEVGGTYIDDIFAGVGWDVSVSDGGIIQMPATLPNQAADGAWSTSNLHRLMESVPGYDPDDLDTVWRSHLLAVQSQLGEGRGVIFDASGDLNDIGREGSATFSDDGYPAAEGSNYGTAEDEMQRDVPRAFLRSATHEVGHAFNQIHQSLEGGIDNSIMTTTNNVATALANDSLTFPDDIALAFNDNNRRHLRHLPDPAVRPGAMGFFGAAVNAPEPNDVTFLDEQLQVSIELGSDRVRLGEPVRIKWSLTNRTDQVMPVPETLDHRDLVSRISVTDPDGNVTFLRPIDQHTCSAVRIKGLEPKQSLNGETTLFYGRDGFTMERPGRHEVTVVVLWDLAGEPVAASASTDLFVSYPISDNDNQVAALLLHPSVGRAVALGDVRLFEGARDRISRAAKAAKTHPACAAMRRLGLTK